MPLLTTEAQRAQRYVEFSGNCAVRDLESLVDDRESLAQLSFRYTKRWIREKRIPPHECVKTFLPEKLSERLHLRRRSIERRHRLTCRAIPDQLHDPKESNIARRSK